MFEIRKIFYQNDEPWKSVRLGNSSETIGSWGSLLTSITMMLTGIGYPDETPSTVNEKMKKAGGFLKALPGPPYVAYVWPNCIYRGITRCENSNAPITKIDADVAAGKPVILQVDANKRMGIQTHFVLVKDKKGDDYILYDPFRDKGDSPDKEVLLTQRYKYNSQKLQETRAILAKEISAVLWFDFDKTELPERPDPKAIKFSLPAIKSTVYAKEERLVLRALPSADSYPWKCLFKGTELAGLRAPDQEDLSAKEWIPVQDPKGDQGYVSAAFVTSSLSDILPPTDADQQSSRKKYCLKKISVQQLVVEMRPYSDPENATKYQGLKPDKSFETLPKYTVVNVLKSDGTMAGLTKILYQETYYNYQQKDWVIARVTGWVNEADLDDYLEDEQEEFRRSIRVDIPQETQTESSTDGQQDFYIDKEKKKARYNMCGELSVAFIAGQGIDEVLNTWRNDPVTRPLYDRMVGNADKPLETSHLESLLRLQKVDYEPYKYDRQGNPRKDYISLADKDGDRRLASEELEARLKDYYFITNLKIDTRTGDLEPAQSSEERNHWVVLDRVTRNRSRIELYNPFPNRLEEYSFGEFYRAVNGDPNSGWWIKKDIRLAALSQKTSVASGASAAGAKKVAMPLRAEGGPPTFEVGVDNQTEYDKDAEQYLYIRGEGSRPKTNLCGEFCVSFILGQSQESSLKHWIETQGKQAGLWELAALLQAYGFNRRKYVKPLNATQRDPGKYYVAPNNKLGLPSDSEQYFKSFSIDTVLEYWKGVQPDLFNSILGGNRNEKTGPDDLITIFKAYGYSREDFSYHRPGSQEDFGYAPGRDAEVVGKTHFVLAGVNISGTTGRLQPVGVAHWVVVTKVIPRGNLVGGNGGWVELYNPFPNCWEEYSYKEFMDSFAPGSTLWIKKEISPVFTQQRLAPAKSKEKVPSTNVKAGQKGDKKGQRGQGKNKRKDAGLPPVDDNPPLDVNRVVCERLDVEAIPWEIGEWISQTANGDEYFAGELAETLCECGILDVREIEVGENKKIQAAVLTDPDFSQKLEAALQTNMKRLASSPRSWDPALKVAGAVLPLFTRTAIQEIKEIRKNMPPQAYESLPEFRAWTQGLASQGTDPLEEDIKKKLNGLISRPDQTETIRVCHTILTRPTSRAFEAEVKKLHSDPKTIAKIKQLWKIKSQAEPSFAEVREWARGLTSEPRKNIYRVRRWGDPEMSDLGFDTSVLEERDQSSNFQAVALYNEATGFGAISNYLIIPPEDVLRLEALQVEDEYETKRGDDWLHQKMNWLCQFRGSIYMFAEEDSYKGEWDWRRREGIRWGTLALGGNLVQVLGTATLPIKLPGKDKEQSVEMARLEGFKPKDWNRPLDELLAEGLVHRCFCVYKGNDLGDSPKGIVYSPFWSPECWQFMPKTGGRPKSFWIPVAYLENAEKETATNPAGNLG